MEPTIGSDASESLHSRIRRDVEQRILDGTWPLGHKLPMENWFMQAYGCSRMTVNKALFALAQEGLIVRRRRAGSFVALPAIESGGLSIPDIRSDVRKQGMSYDLRLLARSVRDERPNDKSEAALAQGGKLLEVRCLHFADLRPIALEDRLIALAVVPEAAEVDFEAIPPGSWLIEHVGWTRAQNRIHAVNVEGEDAKRLEIGEDFPCLRLERKTWRALNQVTSVIQVFPGDAFSVLCNFRPSSA